MLEIQIGDLAADGTWKCRVREVGALAPRVGSAVLFLVDSSVHFRADSNYCPSPAMSAYDPHHDHLITLTVGPWYDPANVFHRPPVGPLRVRPWPEVSVTPDVSWVVRSRTKYVGTCLLFGLTVPFDTVTAPIWVPICLIVGPG